MTSASTDWVKEVTNRGKVMYVNNVTGETRPSPPEGFVDQGEEGMNNYADNNDNAPQAISTAVAQPAQPSTRTAQVTNTPSRRRRTLRGLEEVNNRMYVVLAICFLVFDILAIVVAILGISVPARYESDIADCQDIDGLPFFLLTAIGYLVLTLLQATGCFIGIFYFWTENAERDVCPTFRKHDCWMLFLVISNAALALFYIAYSAAWVVGTLLPAAGHCAAIATEFKWMAALILCNMVKHFPSLFCITCFRECCPGCLAIKSDSK